MSNYKSTLQTNNSALSANNIDLQSLIEQANSLPDATNGVELPTLTNEGTADDLLKDKQLIDGDGNIVTGTFTLDTELTTQDTLISQLQDMVNNLPEAGSGSSDPVLQEKTVTPSTSSQSVTADSGYDGLSKVTVNAIPSSYIEPLATKVASTYTPTTTNQTIASGTYLSGTQTILGDTNLISENIKCGVSIFGVNGSYEASGGGSSDAEIPWLTREVTSYSNPTLTILGAYALSGTNITSLNLPALTTITGYAFYECTTLTDLTLPSLTEIPYNGFRQYKGLVTADLPALKKIGSNGMYQCTNLTSLILRGSTLCTLVAGSTFTGSKILGGTGYVYVPRSLLSSYQSASNWSNLSAQFRALEDYTVDGTITGALDTTKI